MHFLARRSVRPLLLKTYVLLRLSEPFTGFFLCSAGMRLKLELVPSTKGLWTVPLSPSLISQKCGEMLPFQRFPLFLMCYLG